MSSRKFAYSIAFIMLIFFAFVSFGCGGSSDGSGGWSLFTLNINNNTGMPDSNNGGDITYITNNTYNTNITNITNNTNTIITIVNIENNIYDNTKDLSFDEVVASEEPTPDPVPVLATRLSGFVYKDSPLYSGDEAVNLEYISGAHVLLSWGDNESADITTGANGTYSFELDGKAEFVEDEVGKFATYSLTITAEGYRPFNGEVTVAEHAQDELNIALVQRQPASGTIIARDAQSNNKIDGVNVKLFEGWNASDDATALYTGVTNSDGQYEYTNIPTGYYTVELSKENYTSTRFNVTLGEGNNNEDNGYLSRENLASGEYRVVLTWGVYPTDLDSHIYAKNSTNAVHVYYAHKNDTLNGDTLNLDRDDVTSYGPETITFKADDNSSYEYFIHWYSYDDGKFEWNRTEAKIDVYKENEHILTCTVPAPTDTNTYRYWRVFRIVNGVFETINRYSSSYNNVVADY